MLITKDSILNKIPTDLDKEQVFLLEGLRYCANSIHINYSNLYNEINNVSSNNVNEYSYYLIFKEAWGQIDFTYRLYKLLKTMSSKGEPQDNNTLIVGYLKKTELLRHTFEHIDERIINEVIKLNAPVWGNITWVKVVNNKLIKTFLLSAGHPREKIQYTINNPLGKLIFPPIDYISLEATVKIGSEPKLDIINLSQLYRETEKIIKKIESEIQKQFDQQKNKNTLPQDSLVCLDIDIKQ